MLLAMTPLQPISQASHPAPRSAAAKEKLTGVSVLLSFLLAVILIVLGERGLYDLNRLYNTHYYACNQAAFLISVGESCPAEEFAFQNVLLHSYVSFPLFVFFLILMLYLKHHRLNTWQRALFRVSGIVSIFFGLQFLAETIIFLLKFHYLVGIYVTLVLGAIVLSVLVIYLEKRAAKQRLANPVKR